MLSRVTFVQFVDVGNQIVCALLIKILIMFLSSYLITKIKVFHIPYNIVLNWIRVKVTFSTLRATIMIMPQQKKNNMAFAKEF